MFRSFFFFNLIVFLFLAVFPGQGVVFAAYQTNTYDFTSDTVGQAPAGIYTTSNGAVYSVVNYAPFSGNTLNVTDLGDVTSPYFILDNFPESDYQQLVWKTAYSNNASKDMFVIRYSKTEENKVNGYMVMITQTGSIRIYKILENATTLLGTYSTDPPGNNIPAYFRVTANGSSITIEKSSNGTSWVLKGSLTDSSFTHGRVTYRQGYGGPVGTDYVDDIAYTYNDAYTTLATPDQPTNFAVAVNNTYVDMTWDAPINDGGYNITDYAVEYKPTASSTWNTFSDGVNRDTGATVTGLTNNISYDFRVSAINYLGTGTSSATVTDTPTTITSLTITNPVAYRVFQRDDNDLADIDITGTYTGVITGSIEAKWGSGSWTTIDASPSGNTFSGTLTDQSVGQGSLMVRISDETGITATKNYVGVGDIYVVAGQSNNSGRGTNNQTYSNATLKASLFGNDDVWKELSDPYDSSTNQVDSVSADNFAEMGSYIPLLATYILGNTNIPVAFVPVSMGGTSISVWQSGQGLYTSMIRRMNEVGKVKAVLWFQGESDGGSMTQSQYAANLNALVASIQTDFPDTPVVPGMLGESSTPGVTRNTIRLAIKDVIDSNPNVESGPAMYDVDLGSGDPHFTTNADLAIFAERWWYALSKAFYGGADGFGPIVDDNSIYYNTPENAVYMTFTDDSTPVIGTSTATTTAFQVLSNGSSVSMGSLDYLDDNESIRLNLSGTPLTSSDTVTLSYAADNNSAVENAVYDSLGLPAMNFLTKSVTIKDVPSVPLNLLASSPQVGDISATWDAPADDGNSTITDYKIEYKLSSDFSWTTYTDGVSTTTSASLTGLTEGVDYDIRVSALNLIGYSSTQNISDITVSSTPVVIPSVTPTPTQSSIISSGSYISSQVREKVITNNLPQNNNNFCTTLSSFMKVGSRGSDIILLQKRLTSKNLNPGPQDGIFGPLTRSAVIQYQTTTNLVPDGIVGIMTRTSLNKECSL